MTAAALENATRLLMALGGSTNAIVHLVAIAGRLGISLPLSSFDDIAAHHALHRQREALRENS